MREIEAAAVKCEHMLDQELEEARRERAERLKNIRQRLDHGGGGTKGDTKKKPRKRRLSGFW